MFWWLRTPFNTHVKIKPGLLGTILLLCRLMLSLKYDLINFEMKHQLSVLIGFNRTWKNRLYPSIPGRLGNCKQPVRYEQGDHSPPQITLRQTSKVVATFEVYLKELWGRGCKLTWRHSKGNGFEIKKTRFDSPNHTSIS